MINLENITFTMLALEEIKDMGYKEIWIGKCDCPHWEHMDSSVVASPKIRDRTGWPAIWRVSEKLFGRKGCGNGLKNADQVQISNILYLISGYYKLVENEWKSEIFK